MATNISLLITLLDVLANLGDHALPANSLAKETEIRYGRPLVQSDIDDLLTFSLDQGWVSFRVDVFGRNLWYITAAGKTAKEKL